MPSALELAITQFRGQLLAFDGRALTAMLAAYAQIRAELLTQIDALEAELADAGALSPTGAIRLARAQELLRQVEVELTRLGAQADPAIQTGQRQLMTLAGEHAQALTLVTGGEQLAAQLAVRWTRVPTAALEDLVGRLATGAPLRSLLDDLGPQTATAIQDALKQGVALGQNPRVVAATLRRQVDVAGTRLLRITRTEMLNSYRSAMLRTYAANDDLLEGWIWTAAKSARTCAACFPAGTMVSGPRPQKGFARDYAGRLVVIETASGEHLTVTPNHPILTDAGWIAAGLLNVGNDVIRYVGGEGAANFIDVDNHGVPAPIEEVVESFGMVSAEMPCTAPDFHGDGAGSNVYVVRSNRLLRDDVYPTSPQLVDHEALARRVSGSIPIGRALLPLASGGYPLLKRLEVGAGMIAEHLLAGSQRNIATPDRDNLFGTPEWGVHNLQRGIDGLPRDGVGRCERPYWLTREISLRDLLVRDAELSMLAKGVRSDGQGIGPASEQAPLAENVEQSLVVDMADAGRVLRSLAGQIRRDRIVNVSSRPFHGSVYNLQTSEGWYIANGIIVHNCLALDGQLFPLTVDFMPNHPQCRCSPRPKLIGVADPLTETGADWFALQDATTQDRILSSSAAGHAYRAGAVSLDDFAVLHRDARWGDSYQAGTLEEARRQAASRRPRAAD